MSNGPDKSSEIGIITETELCETQTCKSDGLAPLWVPCPQSSGFQIVYQEC